MPLLSPRETQTLQLLAYGKSYKQAALTMGIAISTLKVYLSRAKCKLAQETTHEAILAAERLDLIKEETPVVIVEVQVVDYNNNGR